MQHPASLSFHERLDWFGAACHKGGGGSSQEQTTVSEPWEEQKPYLITGFEGAEADVLNRPLEYFPGSTVTPFSQETQTGLDAQTGRARHGSPLLAGAQDYTGDVLGGQFTDPATNPFLSNVQDMVMSQVQPDVDARFAASGRTGMSPRAQEALGRGVSRGMAPHLFGAYQQERGFQEAAADRAPGLAREDYYDIDRLMQSGAQREGKSEEELADQIARHNFEQSEPTNRLAQYMNLIQGNYGGTSTATGSAKQNVNVPMAVLGSVIGK